MSAVTSANAGADRTSSMRAQRTRRQGSNGELRRIRAHSGGARRQHPHADAEPTRADERGQRADAYRALDDLPRGQRRQRDLGSGADRGGPGVLRGRRCRRHGVERERVEHRAAGGRGTRRGAADRALDAGPGKAARGQDQRCRRRSGSDDRPALRRRGGDGEDSDRRPPRQRRAGRGRRWGRDLALAGGGSTKRKSC